MLYKIGSGARCYTFETGVFHGTGRMYTVQSVVHLHAYARDDMSSSAPPPRDRQRNPDRHFHDWRHLRDLHFSQVLPRKGCPRHFLHPVAAAGAADAAGADLDLL